MGVCGSILLGLLVFCVTHMEKVLFVAHHFNRSSSDALTFHFLHRISLKVKARLQVPRDWNTNLWLVLCFSFSSNACCCCWCWCWCWWFDWSIWLLRESPSAKYSTQWLLGCYIQPLVALHKIIANAILIIPLNTWKISAPPTKINIETFPWPL